MLEMEKCMEVRGIRGLSTFKKEMWKLPLVMVIQEQKEDMIFTSAEFSKSSLLFGHKNTKFKDKIFFQHHKKFTS